jgi:hypothetical protein
MYYQSSCQSDKCHDNYTAEEMAIIHHDHAGGMDVEVSTP